MNSTANNRVAISIIVLTYNQVDYIQECLMSILNQEFDLPMEIVIGDDGSNLSLIHI